MNLSKLTLENLKEVRDDLRFNDLSAEIIRRYELFPELVQALEDLNETIEWLSNSGNLKSPIEPHPYGLAVIQAKQNARAILARANEIKI